MIIEKVINKDLLLIASPRNGSQMWTAVRARKNTKCVACREDIFSKERVFKPLTNFGNRSDRIHEICAAYLEQSK